LGWVLDFQFEVVGVGGRDTMDILISIYLVYLVSMHEFKAQSPFHTGIQASLPYITPNIILQAYFSTY